MSCGLSDVRTCSGTKEFSLLAHVHKSKDGPYIASRHRPAVWATEAQEASNYGEELATLLGCNRQDGARTAHCLRAILRITP